MNQDLINMAIDLIEWTYKQCEEGHNLDKIKMDFLTLTKKEKPKEGQL